MKHLLPYIPDRPVKPRKTGLTMVMDKGLSIREAEDFMSVGSEYTDLVKLGFGTSLLTPGLEKKIRVYKNADASLISEALSLKPMLSGICSGNILICLTDMKSIWLKYQTDHSI